MTKSGNQVSTTAPQQVSGKRKREREPQQQQQQQQRQESLSKQKRQHGEVIVVQCPSDFPTLVSAIPSQRQNTQNPPRPRKREKLLDWDETAREIHRLGATAFEGKQKRNYKEEEYERLTGRKMKHHQVPLPIVRAIAKKAAEREKKRLDDAREAGIVIPTTSKKKKNQKVGTDRSAEVYGPAPSIGFLKNGVFKIKDKKALDRK